MFGTDGHTVKHRTCDDLESFFWILWVMSVNYIGPFNQTRDWEIIECLMTTLTAEQSKIMVYMQGSWSDLGDEEDTAQEVQAMGIVSRAPMPAMPSPRSPLPTSQDPLKHPNLFLLLHLHHPHPPHGMYPLQNICVLGWRHSSTI